MNNRYRRSPWYILTLIVISILSISSTECQGQDSSDESLSLEPKFGMSGFFDVHANRLQESENVFGMGPFEFDLGSQFSDNLSMSAAMVFSDRQVEMGVGFLDMHFFKKSQHPHSPRGRIFTDPGYHIQIGKFDIPFGLDYLFYATPERVTISAPLLNEIIFNGGWTDLGTRVYLTKPSYNATLYIVNGFENGFALGGRVGFRPLENPFSTRTIKRVPPFEVGFSGVYDVDKGSKKEFLLYGIDTEINVSKWRLLYEWSSQEHSQIHLKQQTFYSQIAYKIERIALQIFSRYEEYWEKNDAIVVSPIVKRITTGMTKEIFGNPLLKLEYHAYRGSTYEISEHKEVISAQLVISF